MFQLQDWKIPRNLLDGISESVLKSLKIVTARKEFSGIIFQKVYIYTYKRTDDSSCCFPVNQFFWGGLYVTARHTEPFSHKHANKTNSMEHF
jgi:hypothetical protein